MKAARVVAEGVRFCAISACAALLALWAAGLLLQSVFQFFAVPRAGVLLYAFLAGTAGAYAVHPLLDRLDRWEAAQRARASEKGTIR